MRRSWLLLALSACSGGETSLRPVSGGPSGSAYYPLERGGQEWGDVRVWSPGTRNGVLEVRFRVYNESLEPLSFDEEASFAAMKLDGRQVRALPRSSRPDSTSVPPGHALEFPLFFSLPPNAKERDLEEVEVQWSLLAPNGRLTFTTVFLPLREERPTLGRDSGYVPVWRGHNPVQ